MSQDPACIFCKIVHGEVPSARVLETDRAVAFLDIHPVNKGHTLLIPRDHHTDLSELPDELAGAVGILLPRICRAVRSACGADGLNVISNLGAIAGQTIHHVHWHIIPRHGDDAVRWPWPHQAYDGDELDCMRSAIARSLMPVSGA